MTSKVPNFVREVFRLVLQEINLRAAFRQAGDGLSVLHKAHGQVHERSKRWSPRTVQQQSRTSSQRDRRGTQEQALFT